jgi:hypothetical protein
MTIGANLNGGSLTIGGTSINIGKVNSVTNFSSGTINASYFKLYSSVIDGKPSAWLDTIQSNLTPNIIIGFNNASEIFIGSSKTNIGIGGDAGFVNIANTGLSATGKVNIASGANAVGSEVYLGESSLTRCYIRANDVNINHLNGYNINMGSSNNGTTSIVGNANIGTQAVSNLYLRGAFVVLNDTGGSVNIGGVSSGTINLYRPLTINYGSSLLLNNTGYLGGFKSTSPAAGPIDLYSSSRFMFPIDGLTPGLYQVNGQFIYRGPSTTPYVSIYLITTNYTWTNGAVSGAYVLKANTGGSNASYRYTVYTQQDLYIVMSAIVTIDTGYTTLGAVWYSDQNNNNYVSGNMTCYRIG